MKKLNGGNKVQKKYPPMGNFYRRIDFSEKRKMSIQFFVESFSCATDDEINCEPNAQKDCDKNRCEQQQNFDSEGNPRVYQIAAHIGPIDGCKMAQKGF